MSFCMHSRILLFDIQLPLVQRLPRFNSRAIQPCLTGFGARTFIVKSLLEQKTGWIVVELNCCVGWTYVSWIPSSRTNSTNVQYYKKCKYVCISSNVFLVGQILPPGCGSGLIQNGFGSGSSIFAQSGWAVHPTPHRWVHVETVSKIKTSYV
jgi:hypothetical protein